METYYATHCKPQVNKLLHAVGLDITYHRAEGDYVYFYDRYHNERKVLDILGGYGALLFGHNQPRLIKALTSAYSSQRPFCAQASVRATAGQLAWQLSKLVGQYTGKEYITTFTNSGAEAIEAAIKHAEMEAFSIKQTIYEEIKDNVKKIKQDLKNTSKIDLLNFLKSVSKKYDLGNLSTIDELLNFILIQNHHAFNQQPIYIALKGAFHGKTTGAIKLTDNYDYRGIFQRIGIAVHFVRPGVIDDLNEIAKKAEYKLLSLSINQEGKLIIVEKEQYRINGIFVEPIQGEGGIHEIDQQYLHILREFADKMECPLIMDEIQSGMGRTGTFLASEASGVVADYYLLSKALGGGLVKIAAIMIDKKRYDEEFGYKHTSTFAEDDYSSLVALTALEILQENDCLFMQNCLEKGNLILSSLKDLEQRYPNIIRNSRGRGLMLGFDLIPQLNSPSQFIRLLSEQNLLTFIATSFLLHEYNIRIAPTLSAHQTIRIEPSGYITVEQIAQLSIALEKLCQAIQNCDTCSLSKALVDNMVTNIIPSAPIYFKNKDDLTLEASRKVAFIGHILEPANLRSWDQGFKEYSDSQCEQLLERCKEMFEPYVVSRKFIKSIDGNVIESNFIGIMATSKQMLAQLRENNGAWIIKNIKQAVELAKTIGCSVIGFGGYTSILTNNCKDIIEPDICLTSGNSLTAAASIDVIRQTIRLNNIKEKRLGVVGALGNIGAVMVEALIHDVDAITLIGQEASYERLVRLKTLLESKYTLPFSINIATKLDELKSCNLIVSASNSSKPIILPQHIASDQPVIVCDIAAPQDVDNSVGTSCPNVQLLKGGRISLPLNQSLHVEGVNLNDHIYACIAETILLGMANHAENFSYGALKLAKVNEASLLAKQYGFVFKA